MGRARPLTLYTGSVVATQPFETRLSALEHVLLELAQSQARTQAQLERTDAQLARTDAQLDLLSAEMREFKAESRAAGTRIDRQWGELANRMGSLTEDIILPGIPTVFRHIFGDEGRVDAAIRVS